MEFFILTLKDFGNAMRLLKVFGNNVLDVKRNWVQGIILVAVAYAHAQENELRIGVAMLTRALEKLGSSPSMYHSIDVERIRKKSVEMQKINDLVLFEI